jgi:thiol-disulfide isomerase/thioredoxin
MHLFILLGVLALMLVIIRLYGRSLLGFQNKGREGFASGREVIIVKASWCGHCKTAKPEFERLVAASPVKLDNGSEVTIRQLDADEDASEVKKLGVRGYPTILVGSQEYSGPRTYDGVISFLKAA